MNIKNLYGAICGAAGGLTVFLFGGADGLFCALIAFVVLDYISGLLNAVIGKKLSSRIGFRGISKKILVFVSVALANIVDIQVMGNTNGILRSTVVSFMIVNEGMSILENIAEAGVPIPQKLKSVLKQLHDERRGE